MGSIMKIRTTCPNGSKYYITTDNGGWSYAIKGKPTKAGANVLSNCVGYANGRFAEIQDTIGIKYQLVCNAENFITKAKSYGLSISNKPTLGGILVWEGKGSLAGHVAIVERIDSDNQVFTSESAYGGSAFYNKTRSNSNGNWGMNSNYKYLGCVINPANPEPSPTPSGDENIKYIQRKLNERYNTNLIIDGLYGTLTHKALIIGLQSELNSQYHAGLVVDGIFGQRTKNACPVVRQGANGWITWLIQSNLYCHNYKVNYLDGVYGNSTKKEVMNFQCDNRLYVDGICGKNTFEKLFK